ncbi:2,3-bisphosphoglycerate-independent phosphoglycerate mutase [Candidatus Woesearchaeota archaeon]|nr:2,3-bisphosphoglycerate-independent phosphoglycerate mutase [Candidatus Woesearchaeota archaeon]
MSKAVLIVLDGWGLRKSRKRNAVKLAKTPNFDSYWKHYPHCRLKATGTAVGLPRGYMGNSEVGHLNLGAGRVVKQEVTVINESIKDGSFFRNKVLVSNIKKVKKNKGRLHLMGLLSDAGVHSHINHLFALLKLARKFDVPVLIHVFADGRDTPPKSVMRHIRQLKKKIKDEKIATVSGRYYAMDRDKRWQRTKKAYDAVVNAKGLHAKSIDSAVKQAYARGENDEFILPTVIGDYSGIKDCDGVVFFNYREDRARQLTSAVALGKFGKKKKIDFVCMYEYDASFGLPVAFEKPEIKHVLAEVLSRAGKKQFHIAETEKYAHVTYFFNGGREKPFKNETRKIVPSPKVATYDLRPRMSAAKITYSVLKQLEKQDFIIVNFANPDMVGHTGDLKAAIEAVEFVDACLGRIVSRARRLGIACLITADHGNCEEITGKRETSHTLNDVPCILVSDLSVKLKNGKLGNVAPAILKILGVRKPGVMISSLF